MKDSIKYLFQYKDLIGQNGYYGTPMRVRFLNEREYVEINENNSRKVYWRDSHEPLPDRLSSVDTIDEDTYIADSYEECYKLYCKIRQEQAQLNIDKLEKAIQYQKDRLKSFQDEEVEVTNKYKKAKDSSYPKYINYRTVSIRAKDMSTVIKIKYLFEAERIISWTPYSKLGGSKLIVNLKDLNKLQKLEFLKLMKGLSLSRKVEILKATFGNFTID